MHVSYLPVNYLMSKLNVNKPDHGPSISMSGASAKWCECRVR